MRRFIPIFLILFLAASAGAQVNFNSGVVINQPEENVDLRFSSGVNLSSLTAFKGETRLEGSNFTVKPSSDTETEINLSHFNRTADSQEKLADFNASSSAANVSFTLSNLYVRNIYDIYANNLLLARKNTTGTGELEFTYEDWSENAFEIFRGETKPFENVSVTLTGDYADVVADDATRVPGTYTELEYPYIAMEDSSKVEAVIATVNFKQVTYTQNSRKDIVSIRKGFDGGRFLLPANTGTHQDIEEKEQLVMQNRFLSSSLPSFTGDLADEHTISVIKDYDNLNLTGDFVIDPGATSEILVESTSSSSFQDVISGGNASVRITGE